MMKLLGLIFPGLCLGNLVVGFEHACMGIQIFLALLRSLATEGDSALGPPGANKLHFTICIVLLGVCFPGLWLQHSIMTPMNLPPHTSGDRRTWCCAFIGPIGTCIESLAASDNHNRTLQSYSERYSWLIPEYRRQEELAIREY